jgi:hypothetical protein
MWARVSERVIEGNLRTRGDSLRLYITIDKALYKCCGIST